MKKPELLAPAGSMEALEAVVQAGADAVYLGGKGLNMRRWRSDLNFSDAQVQEALEYAHCRGVKIYVTVNNLYFDSEIGELADHLEFLERVGVDALIVQDLAVASMAREMGISRPLHASVQVGISNCQELELFKGLGYSRAIVSKDLSIEQVWDLSLNSGLELEYFVQGDLCAAHTGQCTASAMIFGESGNRGRCMKPCRWRYQAFTVDGHGMRENINLPGQYLLACKDLNLYPLLPDLVQAGISCFKIEGRMRAGDYLGPLVRAYRRALDRYLEDPIGYRLSIEDWRELIDKRIRDITPGRALGEPGASLYNYTGAREPSFSTRPIEHHLISEVEINSPRWTFPSEPGSRVEILPAPRLSVRVSGLPAVEKALKSGAEVICLGGEMSISYPGTWGRAEVKEAVAQAHRQGAQVLFATPRIAYRREIMEYRDWLGELRELGVDGLLAADWGICQLAREFGGIAVCGDFPLNLANREAFKTARLLGLERATASLEMPMEQLTQLLNLSDLPVEVVAHGHLSAMTLNHDLAAIIGEEAPGDQKPLYGCPGLYLEDEAGEAYRVVIDQYHRTHLMLSQPLCLLPYLPYLIAHNPAVLRLELQYTDADTTGRLVEIYRRYTDLAVKNPAGFKVDLPDWEYLKQLAPAGYTAGALGN